MKHYVKNILSLLISFALVLSVCMSLSTICIKQDEAPSVSVLQEDWNEEDNRD